MGYQASPADDDHALHLGPWSLAPLLRPIDAAIAWLQRTRERIESPAQDGESEANGRKGRVEEAMPEASGPARPSRLRRVAVALLLFACAIGAGTAISYRYLAASVNAASAAVDALHDEVTQLEKDNARLLRDKEKYQKQAYEQEKEIRALRAEADESQAEAETLRAQLDSSKNRGASPSRPDAPRVAALGANAAPKTGVCAMTGASAATSLSRCLEEFNR